MGELAVSGTSGHLLASIGLGSCIGLALLDGTRPLVGLAHIMLPNSNGDADAPAGKFADRAVPTLLEEMVAMGAIRSRLHAVLVGGAQMFSFGGTSGLDIGRRNEEATREALALAGVPVRAAATGGNKGRTVRVHVETGLVTVKEPAAPEFDLYATAAKAGRTR
ncbi:MAG: CheD, stimulates methylation of protein [Actinomycetia bacterium]|jgi:chemotaxis protein CheD|nr:CheD, stimulates methylation of protein [Actinomycetes bacterium]